MLSWGATAAAGLVWLLCALRNGRTLWQASRGRESGSPILLLGGLFGAMAVLWCPLPQMRPWFWLPALLDGGSLPALAWIAWTHHHGRRPSRQKTRQR